MTLLVGRNTVLSICLFRKRNDYLQANAKSPVLADRGSFALWGEELLLQGLLNSDSHGDGHADHGVVASAQEAHHLDVGGDGVPSGGILRKNPGILADSGKFAFWEGNYCFSDSGAVMARSTVLYVFLYDRDFFQDGRNDQTKKKCGKNPYHACEKTGKIGSQQVKYK